MKVIGLYPVDAPEPCHLIEVLLGSENHDFDWSKVTQEFEYQPSDNWQVAYNERIINSEKNTGHSFFII